jgi:acetolactate synthase-1/2/3 large subunit
VAGGGAIASQAGPAIVALAEKTSVPVAMSLNGKGTILDGHPLSAGVVGTYSQWCANRAVSEADLVIFIGSHTGDQVTDVWTVPPPGTPVIQIDADPSELGRSYPNTVSLLGDARATVERLSEVVEAAEPDGRWTGRVAELVAGWRREQEPFKNSEASPVRPERICKEITGLLPDDAILVSDTGHSAAWTGTMVDLTHPGQSFIRCAGSLGWAFPASLGAKCAAPDRPVICFTGDGGFWYHLSEMETAVRAGINTVTVVNNNHSLNQDKASTDLVYKGQTGLNPDEGWMFTEVDFAQVAESMGLYGIRVERAGDIRGALERALASGRPAVVDVATDIEAFAPWSRRPSQKW